MRNAFGIWTIIVAISVSIVAAYYSILGLTALFAGAILPVIIMGAALEIAKITTAIWLHTFWDECAFLMKVYLVPATIILMFITSMGIFGFLSKAHIEQSASGSEISARIERLDQDILRQQNIIERANITIDGFSTQVTSADTSIQARIDGQQAIIDDIRSRLETDIAIQNAIIDNELTTLSSIQAQLARLSEQRDQLALLQQSNDVRALQALVGAEQDGILGAGTRRQITEYSALLDQQQQEVTLRLEQARTAENPIVTQAREQIQLLQAAAATEIQQASAAIDQFRTQLINVTTQDHSAEIAAQNALITETNSIIDEQLEERFALEAELRQIEVEVGPVKYIAELIYGDTSDDLLEQAVRWVILILVAVFDPLAVILILAGVSILQPKHKHVVPPDTPGTPTLTPTLESEEYQPPVNLTDDVDITDANLARPDELAGLDASGHIIRTTVKES